MKHETDVLYVVVCVRYETVVLYPTAGFEHEAVVLCIVAHTSCTHPLYIFTYGLSSHIGRLGAY